jgi:hypothetical protein
MKLKMAIEMEFDIPTPLQKAIEGRIDEFCEEIAKVIVDDTARATIAGIGVKYIGNCWLGENDMGYANGVLDFGNDE